MCDGNGQVFKYPEYSRDYEFTAIKTGTDVQDAQFSLGNAEIIRVYEVDDEFTAVKDGNTISNPTISEWLQARSSQHSKGNESMQPYIRGPSCHNACRG